MVFRTNRPVFGTSTGPSDMNHSTHFECFAMNPYEILDVDENASQSQIKWQHHKKVLTCHSDKFSDESLRRQKADEFHRVQLAYEILSNKIHQQKDGESRATIEIGQREKREGSVRTLPVCHLVIRNQPETAQSTPTVPRLHSLEKGKAARTTRNRVPIEDTSNRVSDISESPLADPSQNRSETAMMVVYDWNDGFYSFKR